MAVLINPVKFKRLREALGYSQSELARICKVSQALIGKIEGGGANSSSYLHIFAKHLETTPEYLTDVTDDPSEGAASLPTLAEVQDHFQLVKITKLDAQFGMGESFLGDHPEAEELLVSRGWLKTFTTAKPEEVVIIQGIGNSMEPTISNRDWLICNKARTVPKMMDDIFVFTHYGQGGIKRIRTTERGVELISDNKDVPPQVATPDALHILARVDSIIRRV